MIQKPKKEFLVEATAKMATRSTKKKRSEAEAEEKEAIEKEARMRERIREQVAIHRAADENHERLAELLEAEATAKAKVMMATNSGHEDGDCHQPPDP